MLTLTQYKQKTANFISNAVGYYQARVNGCKTYIRESSVAKYAKEKLEQIQKKYDEDIIPGLNENSIYVYHFKPIKLRDFKIAGPLSGAAATLNGIALYFFSPSTLPLTVTAGFCLGLGALYLIRRNINRRFDEEFAWGPLRELKKSIENLTPAKRDTSEAIKQLDILEQKTELKHHVEEFKKVREEVKKALTMPTEHFDSWKNPLLQQIQTLRETAGDNTP